MAISETLRRSAPHPVSAGRLADEFGVTRRTIERDIAALLAAGVPLYAERGRTGGHISLDQAGNTVVSLSPTEVTALLIALHVAGPNMPFADAGTSAAERLLGGLPAVTRLAVEELRTRIRATSDALDPISRRIRRTTETAVQRRVVVNITYEDSQGRHTRRAVEALGFYRGAEHWFLVGWCQLRNDGRIFRLDRIARASLTTARCADRDLDDALGWVPADTETP